MLSASDYRIFSENVLVCFFQLYNLFTLFAFCCTIRIENVSVYMVNQVMPWSLQRGIILKFDEALRRPGILREQRGRGACVVCAQQFWKHELKELILFTDPESSDLPKQDHVAPAEQYRLCDLLGVTRYLERWRHFTQSDIAQAELVASSVLHPFTRQEQRVLLHRAALTDDLQQPQMLCSPCRRALASDLWMGRCPPGLLDLNEGTQRLLPMVRACVQVTVLQPANTDRAQRQKGMIGAIPSLCHKRGRRKFAKCCRHPWKMFRTI